MENFTLNLIEESNIIKEIGYRTDSKDLAIKCAVAYAHRMIDIISHIDKLGKLNPSQIQRKEQLEKKTIDDGYKYDKMAREDYIYLRIGLETEPGTILERRITDLLNYRAVMTDAIARMILANKLKYKPNMSYNDILKLYNIA